MQLYFHSERNVGDQLNSWLWESVMGKTVESLEPSDALFIGIGTILRNTIPQVPARKFVLGAGCGYDPPPEITPDWEIVMVRGPLTAKLLNLPPESAVTDPGVLIRDFYSKSEDVHGVGFMPHYSSAVLCKWKEICEDLGIVYMDPSLPIDPLMEKLVHCRLLITEAMHGAIMADAIGVPWHALKTRRSILTFKWQDWASSLGMDVGFTHVPPPYRTGLKRVVTSCFTPVIKHRIKKLIDQDGVLSDRSRLNAACDELRLRISEFRDRNSA